MKFRKLLTDLLQIILYVAALTYFISCSSSENDKYSLITKEERKTIKEFCICTEPVQPLMERFMKFMTDSNNLKDIANDTVYIRSMSDSLETMIKELAPCAEKAKYLFDSKDMAKEKEEQLLAYFKKYYPKCLPLVLGEEKTDTIKIK